MTDHHPSVRPVPGDDDSASASTATNRRRLLLAGAGLAGAAALVKTGTAAAADGDDVVVGGSFSGNTPTTFTNTDTNDATPGNPGEEAIVAITQQAMNGSHTIRAVTNGTGHAIAGDIPASAPNTVAATWGRHGGLGAGVGGVNVAPTAPLAGGANGVVGDITSAGNGSHAVLGRTNGAGHSVAGDTPADAQNGSGGPNTTAATWGRHGGLGAGIGGVSAMGYGGEFVGGRAQVRLIQTADPSMSGPPTDAGHLLGELYADPAGNLWFNRADGSNFTKLNNQGGITLFADPQRAYDSREEFASPANGNKGRHAAGSVREIDLAEFTDLPAGAAGAVINLTVADTDPLGFVTVFNGATADDARPNASSINYKDAGMFVANGITVAISPTATVKVYASAATEVVIDVVGYVS
jgi:hypothetical protein